MSRMLSDIAPARQRKAWIFSVLTGSLCALVLISAAELWRHDPRALFWITWGYLGYEAGLHALLAGLTWVALRTEPRFNRKRSGINEEVADGADLHQKMSVIIAAHNERSCILDTLESVFAQLGVEMEVLVASDGSTDGMNALLVKRYGLHLVGRCEPAGEITAEPAGQLWTADGALRLLALPKVGKGAALNAALSEARGGIVVTLDADTRLAPGALAALAKLFERDARVASAGGFIYVRHAVGGPWIARYQFWEYVKNFMWRIGAAHFGLCLQVSGAFGAFRKEVLVELGGFSETSRVEDYEIIYRLHERLRLAGRDYVVDVAPDAVAYTDGPETALAFIHQRTRWFAGFLQTLWDYRRLVGDRRMGPVGLFMLPLKCVDAVLPIWGMLSLAILIAAALGGADVWKLAALGLFAGKWAFDIAMSAILWRWHERLFGGRAGMPSAGRLAFYVLTEGLVFHWFRQIAVMCSYTRFWRREQNWRQPRWDTRLAPAVDASPVEG